MTGHSGTLFLLVGPSGSGKTSILNTLLSVDCHIKFSISSTSRKARPTEVDGKEYNFLSRARFQEKIDRGEFLEYAEYVGNLYGTEREQVERYLAVGDDVLADIEIKGANQIKIVMPECVRIFIMPPDAATLRDRLSKRGTETEKIINDRVNRAREELRFVDQFDFVVINDDLEKATAHVKSIIEIHRLRPVHCVAKINKVLRSFE